MLSRALVPDHFDETFIYGQRLPLSEMTGPLASKERPLIQFATPSCNTNGERPHRAWVARTPDIAAMGESGMNNDKRIFLKVRGLLSFLTIAVRYDLRLT